MRDKFKILDRTVSEAPRLVKATVIGLLVLATLLACGFGDVSRQVGNDAMGTVTHGGPYAGRITATATSPLEGKITPASAVMTATAAAASK